MRQSYTKQRVYGGEYYLEDFPIIQIIPGQINKLGPIPTDVLEFNAVKCINSVIFGTSISAGAGLITCQIGIWHQIPSGYIRFSINSMNLIVEYEGSNNIELGEFSLVYSPIDANKFTQPTDFPPLVVIPPSRTYILQFSDDDEYELGKEYVITTGTGRLHSVIADLISDPNKGTNTSPYRSWKYGTTTSNISTLNATCNKALYSPGDGLGVKTTNMFSDGYNVFKVNVIDDNNWSITWIPCTYAPYAGNLAKLYNMNSDGTPASEYFKITSLTV